MLVWEITKPKQELKREFVGKIVKEELEKMEPLSDG
jgi:hypothetical protein